MSKITINAMRKIAGAAVVASSLGLAGCGGTSGSSSAAPSSATDSCVSKLRPWVDFFDANLMMNGQYVLQVANSAGVLYGTGGTGGQIGEWLRETALMNYNPKVWNFTPVSVESECSSLAGKDLSWIPSPPGA